MESYLPLSLLIYLDVFRPLFPAHNFLYFQGFMVSYMLLGTTRKCVSNMARVCFFVERSLSSWERFLSQYRWDPIAITQHLVSQIQAKLGKELFVEGALLCWLDTTLVAKVKGKMPGVQKWHDHSGNPDRGESLIGQHLALTGLVCQARVAGQLTALCWPLLINLISGQLNSLGFVVDPKGVARAMTFWDTVCPLMAQLQLLLGNVPMRVVADAYFAKAPFINWMLRLGIQVITRMRDDGVGWDDPEPLPLGKKRRGKKSTKPPKGKKWKISELLKVLPHEEINVTIYGKTQKLRVVSRDLWLRDIESQKVRVVVVETKGKPLILLSTDLTLLPKAIIQIYALRFPAELTIRDLKQHFGLGDYQCTSLTAITRFLMLSLTGFCLWRLVQLDHLDADWLKQDRGQTAPLSFGHLSRSIRRFTLGKIIHKSALQADFQNSETLPVEVRRLIA